MNTYVWGLDLSMSNTGISIFDLNGNIKKITNIKTNNKETHGLRLKCIANKILEMIIEFPPEKIIIERGFSRFNISTAVLYRTHGVINYLLCDYEQIYYTTKTIKKIILNGSATKQQIGDKILSVYPDISFENNNESDSCAVGITYFIKKGIINWK